MSELLIQAVNPLAHPGTFVAGDVLAVKPDGFDWGWGDPEMHPGQWHGRTVLIRLPGLLISPDFLLEQGMDAITYATHQRRYQFDYAGLERRDLESRYDQSGDDEHPLHGRYRATLHHYFWINRPDLTAVTQQVDKPGIVTYVPEEDR
ncbi:hypothetical protein [Magnetospira sp. QH-2]|uniref:hypothetical protein n=1 Tax=Magnetospira sp. (strain QH-2) TaxID=1288970 RepID=UPI0003E80E5C|nr:hypothetical protein [Magnetospira sp. QH-2]CCQ72752.1 protein of unknown function [Magnetospira sp. QH-2]